jgi:hypothetical protein
MPTKEWILIILIVLGIGVGIGLPSYLGVIFYRKYNEWSVSALASILSSYPEPKNDTMYQITFHTYHGFLLWVTQTKHVILFNPDNIESTIGLLRALRKFTLKWGFFAYGALFIPILSFFEYRKDIKILQTHRR